MRSSSTSLRLLLCVVLAFAAALSACAPRSIVYENTRFGFSFTLPGSWQGYKIEVANWQGFGTGPDGGAIVQTGPLVLIHHPAWTPQNPRQDIPIMVFTVAQWNAVNSGDFLVSAAPVPPTELGRNTTYVFALPPRYDYAELPGFQEVEAIVAGNPLHTP